MVTEEKNSRHIIQIWMMQSYILLGIVEVIVYVCYGNFHPPVAHVILLYVSMNTHSTHMACTLKHRSATNFLENF